MSTVTVELSAVEAATYLPTRRVTVVRGPERGDLWTREPPVRVWLPLTADQAEVLCDKRHASMARNEDKCHAWVLDECSKNDDGEFVRQVAAGDRVCAVTPCEDCPGDGVVGSEFPDEYGWHECQTCSGSGRVSVWSASITEVLPAGMSRGRHESWIENMNDGRAKLWRPPYGKHVWLPGDWRSAVVGVRLSDVEPV